MLTFDEFFRKKRIDLTALQNAEPVLFSEFKTHYEQMGEKSFDHTKKYWFNKTRREFPLAVEVKTEKPHIANPLAEQTITESLSETQAPAPLPKVGFTPRFKASVVSKPIEPVEDKTEQAADTIAVQPTAPKVGFTPRFKAGVTAKPDAAVEEKSEEKTPPAEEVPEKPIDAAPKVGFTPRFKAGVTKQAAPIEENPAAAEEKPVEATEVKPPISQGLI